MLIQAPVLQSPDNVQQPNIRSTFQQQGYIVLKQFFTPAEVQALLQAIQVSPRQAEQDVLSKGAMTFYSKVYLTSEWLQAFISQQRIIDVLTTIAGGDLWVRWDQAVDKGPGADTFPWHQDNAYNGLWDGHYQFWVALTEMTPENGGLCLKPGSHKSRLPHKPVGNAMVYDGVVSESVSISAEPGDVVVFSSFLLHSTTPNVTRDSRWAYVVEYMRLDDCDPYLQPPYFVVARNGQSCPEMVTSHKGSQSRMNQIKYYLLGLPDQARQLKRRMLKFPHS
jgi:hypothetical protein